MVIFGKDFNPKTDMAIKEKKTNRSGSGSSAGIVNVNTSRSLFIQTPMMLTWGVNEIRDKKTRELQGYSMSLQFPRDEDENNDAEMQDFLDHMIEFDDIIRAEAIKNSMKWCKQKKLTKESVQMLYDPPVVKYPRYPEGHEMEGDFDKTRKPTIRVKLPFYNREFNTEIYDGKMKRLFPRNAEGLTPPDIIGKGDNVIVIMQCGGVWFANNKFGVTWKLHQVILQKKENLRGRCFIQLSDREKDNFASSDDIGGDDEDKSGEGPPLRTMSSATPSVKSGGKGKGEAAAEASGEDADDSDEGGDLESVLTSKSGPRFKNVKLQKKSTVEKDDDIDLEGLEDDLS